MFLFITSIVLDEDFFFLGDKRDCQIKYITVYVTFICNCCRFFEQPQKQTILCHSQSLKIVSKTANMNSF